MSSKHIIDTHYLHIDTWSIPGDKKPEVHMFDHTVSAFTAMLGSYKNSFHVLVRTVLLTGIFTTRTKGRHDGEVVPVLKSHLPEYSTDYDYI